VALHTATTVIFEGGDGLLGGAGRPRIFALKKCGTGRLNRKRPVEEQGGRGGADPRKNGGELPFVTVQQKPVKGCHRSAAFLPGGIDKKEKNLRGKDTDVPSYCQSREPRRNNSGQGLAKGESLTLDGQRKRERT